MWSNRNITFLILSNILIGVCQHCSAQNFDYSFINRSTSLGSGVEIIYSDSLADITISVFDWLGTVSGSPVLSDTSGNLLGYFNCRNVYDSIGRIAINGDNMAVGFYQNFLFPSLPEHEGLGNGGNCAFIPITDSLFYLFYKSSEIWVGAPEFAIHFEEQGHDLSSYSEGLYLTKVRLNSDHRLFILESEKHILLSDELFQYKNLLFCKHANGIDWWLIVPHALGSQASRFLVFADGQIEHFDDIEFSDNFWRVRSTSEFAFSPSGENLVRIIIRPIENFKHIFEYFKFNRCDGTVDRLFVDSLDLPQKYTFGADVEFSDNGKYLYTAIGSLILQMDVTKEAFFLDRDTIAKWDGFLYQGFLEPIFDALWKLPNGRILVASGVSTPFLHYILEPDKPGDQCHFQQRAIMLPIDPLNEPYGVAIESLPRFPPFRMAALTTLCTNSISAEDFDLNQIQLFPNPTFGNLTLEGVKGLVVTVLNMFGHELFHFKVPKDEDIQALSLEKQVPGIYIFIFTDDYGQVRSIRKCVKL